MKSYFGFDDTDAQDLLYGTDKLARWFESALPEGCECLGVVGQKDYATIVDFGYHKGCHS